MMHDFVMWGVFGLIALEALIHVGRTGRPRKALTPTDAVAGLIEWSLIAMAVLYLGGAL